MTTEMTMAAPPGLRKKPLTAYLEPEQWEQLTALSRRTGTPMNWYIRQGINLILEQHRRLQPA